MESTLLVRAAATVAAADADPNNSAATLAILLQVVKGIYDTRLTALSAGSIVIWEHLSTFDQEIDLVWKARWSLGKILFLFNRYYTLFAVAYNLGVMFSPELTDTTCFRWFMWQGVTGLISVFISQLTLLLRLYALYYRNKTILWMTAVTFVVSLVAAASVLITNLVNVKATSQVAPGLQFCIPNGLSDHFWLYWVPILAFESLICVLALIRAFSSVMVESTAASEHLRDDAHSARCGFAAMIPRRLYQIFTNGQRIIDVLIRDSILFFMAMFAAYLVNCLIWRYGDASIFETPIAFSEAFACVLSSRMLLNIRGVHKTQESEEPAYPMQDLSRSGRGPAPGATSAVSSRGTQPAIFHIQTIVETITVRDGDPQDTDDELDSKTSTPIAHIPMHARDIESDIEAQVGAGRGPTLLRQLSDGDRMKLRNMKAR